MQQFQQFTAPLFGADQYAAQPVQFPNEQYGYTTKRSGILKWILLALCLLLLLILAIVALALIPVYLNGPDSNSTLTTTVNAANLGMITPMLKRMATLNNGTMLDTAATTSGIQSFFNGMGAQSTVVTFTNNAMDVFTIACVLTFVETFDSSLSVAQQEAMSIASEANIRTIFNSAITSLVLTSPPGATAVKTTDFNTIGINRNANGGTAQDVTVAATQTPLTTVVSVENLGTITPDTTVASKRILTFMDGTMVDTTELVAAISDFFSERGAQSTVVSFTPNGNIFFIAAVITFVEMFDSTLTTTEIETLSIASAANVNSLFADIELLVIPPPVGTTVVQTTDIALIVINRELIFGPVTTEVITEVIETTIIDPETTTTDISTTTA